MLFGDQQYEHLPEEVIQILIDSGVARSQWDAIGRQMQAANLHRNKNTFMGAMKRFGLPIAAMGTLFGLTRSVNPMRPLHPKTGSIRQGTSLYNLQDGQEEELLERQRTPASRPKMVARY